MAQEKPPSTTGPTHARRLVRQHTRCTYTHGLATSWRPAPRRLTHHALPPPTSPARFTTRGTLLHKSYGHTSTRRPRHSCSNAFKLTARESLTRIVHRRPATTYATGQRRPAYYHARELTISQLQAHHGLVRPREAVLIAIRDLEPEVELLCGRGSRDRPDMYATGKALPPPISTVRPNARWARPAGEERQGAWILVTIPLVSKGEPITVYKPVIPAPLLPLRWRIPKTWWGS